MLAHYSRLLQARPADNAAAELLACCCLPDRESDGRVADSRDHNASCPAGAGARAGAVGMAPPVQVLQLSWS